MEGPSLYPSSKVHQLRQLMSLDCPLVTLTSSSITKYNNKKSGSHKLKIRPSFTFTRKSKTKNLPSSSSPPCLICTYPGSNKSLITITSQKLPPCLPPLLREGGGSRDLEREESWVFCKVCHGTVTKLLRLLEEVDDIKARITTVLKLRGKLEEEEDKDLEVEERLDPGPRFIVLKDEDEDDDVSNHDNYGQLLFEAQEDGFIQEEDGSSVNDCHSVPQETELNKGGLSRRSPPRDDLHSATVEEGSKLNNLPSGGRQRKSSSSLLLPPCYFCNKTFPSATTTCSIQTHIRLHHTMERHKHLYPRRKPRAPQPHKGQGALLCPKCGVRLTQRSSLNKHMRDIHSLDIPKKYFKHFCPICKKFFGSDLVFQAHSHPSPSDPEKVLYICHVCFKTFNNRPCFHNHKALHQGRQKVPHRCYFCSKPYQNRKCLQSHMRTHTSERLDPCPKCGKGFTTKQRLRRHKGSDCGLNPKSTRKTLKCPKCGIGFTQRSGLNTHMRNIHSLDIPKKYFKHFCPICKRFFGSDLVFQAHSHPNPSVPEKVLYTCAVCDKTFHNKPCFHNHKALHQGQRKVPIPCYFCNKVCSDLQSHMRTHTLERPYMCGKCGMDFPGPTALERHIARNCDAEEKTPGHQCHLCGKVLGSRSTLLAHMKWAHEEKTKILLPASTTTSEGHICPKCGKSFQQKCLLSTHMKQAHRLDPILPPSEMSCPICSRVFMSRELFDAHTHPDESDPSKVLYTCSICGRSYGSRQAYHTHVVAFHRDQTPAQCHSCGKVFQSDRAANAHEKLCSSNVEARTCRVEGCDQVFPTPRERLDHERVVHKGLSSTQCALCSKFFRSAKDLNDHARTHGRVKMDNN